MKLRTTLQVVEKMDADLARRKRQLTTLRQMVGSARPHELDVLLRCGYCLVYSHWEGFVKEACTMYLNFLHYNPQPIVKLKPALIALSLRGDLTPLENTGKVRLHTAFVSKVLGLGLSVSAIPWSDIINTRDNLNYEVLSEIYLLLGLDVGRYEIKQNIIDEKLLSIRNGIAHGRLLDVDEPDFSLVMSEIVTLLDWVRTDVQNALQLKSYLV